MNGAVIGDATTWSLRPGYRGGSHIGTDMHATVTESTTGAVACGESWCNGRCGLPALVLVTSFGKEYRAFGSMVACGPVFQYFRVPWTGEKHDVTLGATTEDEALKRIWL